PVQLNTKRIPKLWYSQPPTPPRVPNSTRSRKPMATGGSTSGRWISPSITILPGKRVLERNSAAATAKGSAANTATPETRRLSSNASASSGVSKSVMPQGWHGAWQACHGGRLSVSFGLTGRAGRLPFRAMGGRTALGFLTAALLMSAARADSPAPAAAPAATAPGAAPAPAAPAPAPSRPASGFSAVYTVRFDHWSETDER